MSIFNSLFGHERAQRGKSEDAVSTESYQGNSTGSWKQDKGRRTPEFLTRQKVRKKAKRKQVTKSKRLNRCN